MTAMHDTNPDRKWELTAPTFPTMEKAANWAGHLARCSQRRCRVAKRAGRWRVWRQINGPSDTTVEVN